MRRIDPVGAILGSGVLLLLVLCAGLWIADGADAMRDGRAGEPVTVEIEAPADAGAITVSRISPRGNRVALPNVPGRPLWTSAHEWFADLEVASDGATLARIGSAVVTVGSRRFTFTGDALRERWPKAAQEQVDRVALHAPAELRAEPSRVGSFDRFLNWPGDAAVLGDLLLTVHAWRVALLLLCVVLLRRHARAAPERRAALERFAARATAAVLALFVLAVLGPIFVSRIARPLSNEHLEGVQATCTAIWDRQGGDLFAPPTIDGCGNIYTPAYYLVSALWSRLFGLGLPSLRLLTWLFQAIGALAAGAVLRELGAPRSRRWWLPLYLATFCFYAWIDNANKDGMHVALSLCGFALLARSLRKDGSCTGVVAAALGGVLWAAAFMTKQSHVAIVAPTLLVLLVVAPVQAIVAGGAFAACAAGATLLATRTWPDYWDWTVTIPKAHAFSAVALGHALVPVVAAFGGYFVVALLGWLRLARSPDADADGARRRRLAHLCFAFALGGIVMGCMSAGKDRGGAYALAPGLAALCIPVAVLLGAPDRGRGALALPLLLLVLGWPGGSFVSGADRASADRLVAKVAGERGEVWVPLEPFANVLANKRAYVPGFCLGEWTAAGRPLPDAVLAPIRAGHFAMIVTPWNPPEGGGADLTREPFPTIAAHYEVTEVVPREEAFAVKEGWTNSLRLIWRPKRK
jgi:putative copper export protein